MSGQDKKKKIAWLIAHIYTYIWCMCLLCMHVCLYTISFVLVRHALKQILVHEVNRLKKCRQSSLRTLGTSSFVTFRCDSSGSVSSLFRFNFPLFTVREFSKTDSQMLTHLQPPPFVREIIHTAHSDPATRVAPSIPHMVISASSNISSPTSQVTLEWLHVLFGHVTENKTKNKIRIWVYHFVAQISCH